ncbi:MAG: hypothetical protein WDN27_01410 [Candidatus Saccharibacteria bacterium]
MTVSSRGVTDVTYGSTINLEISANPATDTFTYYLNGLPIYSSSAQGHGPLTDVIFDNYNDGVAGHGYTTVWTDLRVGVASPPPTVSACTTTNVINTTNLSTWDTTQTRAHGHNVIVGNGLQVYTDGNSDTDGTQNTDKAAAYYTTSFPLSSLGNQTIAQSLDNTNNSGGVPACSFRLTSMGTVPRTVTW